jgi:glycosyltransferase involved in cell wall biosynthesis
MTALSPIDRTWATDRPLRIALLSPPFLPLPPTGYAGTERVVSALAVALQERGNDITVFAPGDSSLPCPVIPIVHEALWPQGRRGNLRHYLQKAVTIARQHSARFDVIHSHVDIAGFELARQCTPPVISTLHGRLDGDDTAPLIDRYTDIPLVAISESQRRWHPDANWVATIHHGLDFSATPQGDRPGDYLLLVGRVVREKGVVEAIELARATGRRLVIAAKVHEAAERELFETTVRPAMEAGIVDWRGEVDTKIRDSLMKDALATVMLGGWPEPFGLVAIESMATGTPVIARRAGALPELIDHGYNGFLVDDDAEARLAVERVGRLDRRAVSAYARGRFSVDRMAARYERLFRQILADRDRRLPPPQCRCGQRPNRRHGVDQASEPSRRQRVAISAAAGVTTPRDTRPQRRADAPLPRA